MNREPLSIGFISLGCAKNLVDSQVMAGVLVAEKLRLAPSPEEADLVLVNTCAFIRDAREEAAAAIVRACRLKTAGRCRAVIVTGCLPQRYRERMADTFPDVDAFLGVDELERIADVVRHVAGDGRAAAGATPRLRVLVSHHAPRRLFRQRVPGLRFSSGPFAYVKVAEGCNHVCAFCAIPGIRGRYRSRVMGDLVAEARALLASGARELNLVSQDTTGYGLDLRSGPPRRGTAVSAHPGAAPAARLPALLRALDALDGEYWIRLLYGYPALVSDELLSVMASARHVCAYLDLPIQHSHPEILRAMRRADTLRAVADLPRRLRRAIPGIALRTTCLVGFPGETEEHFRHLLAYVEEARFDHLGVFVFSPEEGTAAEKLPETPPAEVAAERRERLLRLQQQVVVARRRELAGTDATALLIRPEKPGRSDGAWIARLPRQAPDVDGITRVLGVPAGAHPGEFAPVRITGGRGCDLAARAGT